MKILHVAYYTLKRNIKNSIISMFMLPLVLIFILGFSLKEIYNPANFFVQDAAVYAENSEDFTAFKNYVNSSNSFKDKFKLTEVENKEQGINGLEERRYDAFIYIVGNKDLSLYMKQLDNLNASFFKVLVSSYKSSEKIDNSDIKHVQVQTENKRPTSFDYYSVTMLVMVILYGAKYGKRIIFEDRNIDNKMGSLPIRKNQIIIGKMLGIVTLIFLTSISVVSVSKLLYKIHWGTNYLLLGTVILIYSFFSVNLGMAISTIVKDDSISGYIIEIMIGFFTFVAGGYVTRDFFGEALKRISIISPSYAMHNIIFKIMYGYSTNVRGFYLELIMLSVLTFGAVLVLERGKTY